MNGGVLRLTVVDTVIYRISRPVEKVVYFDILYFYCYSEGYSVWTVCLLSRFFHGDYNTDV